MRSRNVKTAAKKIVPTLSSPNTGRGMNLLRVTFASRMLRAYRTISTVGVRAGLPSAVGDTGAFMGFLRALATEEVTGRAKA